jgi:drug/metabolite transporter (DMT)-like permease
VVLTQAIGLAAAIVVLLAVGESIPSGGAIGWALLGGAAGGLGIAALYRGLTTGPMGPIASIAAVVGAGLPTVVGAIAGDQLRLVDMAGIALALVALALVTRSSEHSSLSRETVVLAILAGVGAGLYFVAMGHSTAAGSGTWSLIVASRSTSLVLAAALLAMSGGLRTLTRGLSPLIVGIGLGDVAGSAFFLLASGLGSLSIAAVVASQHPAVVTILARLILKERLARIQMVGIVTALVAIALIASP